MSTSTDQPDPEDAVCTACDLPYTVRTGWASDCEEHTEFWCEAYAAAEDNACMPLFPSPEP